jgi:UDP-4-amino-4,6-dideoxy-N-acetyl-beta-L-altrosamine N-acetyltransferase
MKLINFIELNLEQKKMILEWRNHPDVRKWMYTNDKISLKNHLEFIESLINNKNKAYFLLQDEIESIGVVDFYNFTRNSCEFGFYSNPFSKVIGIGRIMEEASINYAFEVLGLEILKLEVYSDNIQVRNLHKKYKFQESGVKSVNDKEVICMELKNENR